MLENGFLNPLTMSTDGAKALVAAGTGKLLEQAGLNMGIMPKPKSTGYQQIQFNYNRTVSV